MNNRIREVRKLNKMNQAEFGSKIGVKGNTIGNYELGLRNPSDAVIFSICREFNINEEWLRTGNGEMHVIAEDEVAAIVSELLEDSNPLYDVILSIAKTYQGMDAKSQKVINDFAIKLSKELKKGG